MPKRKPSGKMEKKAQVPIRRVAVVGAGVSGLVAIKACLEENMYVECFEFTSDLGGLWKLNETDGITSVMESTVMHSSKEMGAFSDFPPPLDFPVFLNHKFQLEYLRMYANHFGLRDYIRLRHKVLQVFPDENHESNGRWTVRVQCMESSDVFEKNYDAVMICTGRNKVPRLPAFDGLSGFGGLVLHSNDYKRPDFLRNKRVLVIGAGNSGGDIATELSRCAEQVYLSCRRGCWLFPRVGPGGKPLDVFLLRREVHLLRYFSSFDFSSRVLGKIISSRVDQKNTGLRPLHPILSQFPLINDQLSECLLNGSVRLVGAIRNFTKTSAILDFTKLEDLDAVILATGFDSELSGMMKYMLPPDLTENLRAYKRVFPLGSSHHTLAFVGMVGSFGPLGPPLELQARWIASVWAGKSKLPGEKIMERDVSKFESYIQKHMCKECYHRDQIDWMSYMDELSSLLGVKPNLWKMFFRDPRMFWRCLAGPCLPYSFRLEGPHHWTGAKEAILTSKHRLHFLCNSNRLTFGSSSKKSSPCEVTRL